MTFRLSQLEDVVNWCSTCSELAAARSAAWRTFFGEDDPRPVRYWPGGDDPVSRQRRFMGWFMFSFALPDGRCPSQLAVEKLYVGAAQAEVLGAIQGARYVMAIVTSVVRGQGLFLELQDERLEVRSRTLGQVFERGMTLVSHLVPSRPGLWIPGPGWVQWPTRLGPNIRRELKKFQPDPISVERLMQMRSATPEGNEGVERPKDATLEQAASRMTEAAKAAGKPQLVKSPEEWKALVLEHMSGTDITAFTQEFIGLVGDVKGIDELNRWLGLVMNIWSATPQPDRGGRTAYELLEEERGGWHRQ